MRPLRKITGIAFTAILLTHSLFASVRGQLSPGPLHIKGTVICAGCSLEELYKTLPGQHQFCQLTHPQGQVVIDIHMVNHSPRWRPVSWPGEVNVRASDALFRQLSAEENLFKEIEIIGLFSTTRALDIFEVKIAV